VTFRDVASGDLRLDGGIVIERPPKITFIAVLHAVAVMGTEQVFSTHLAFPSPDYGPPPLVISLPGE